MDSKESDPICFFNLDASHYPPALSKAGIKICCPQAGFILAFRQTWTRLEDLWSGSQNCILKHVIWAPEFGANTTSQNRKECLRFNPSHPPFPPLCPQICSLPLQLYSWAANKLISWENWITYTTGLKTGSFQVALVVRNAPENVRDARDLVSIPRLRRFPRKEMATHSSILAWEIPWTEVHGGSQRSDTTEWLRTERYLN